MKDPSSPRALMFFDLQMMPSHSRVPLAYGFLEGEKLERILEMGGNHPLRHPGETHLMRGG